MRIIQKLKNIINLMRIRQWYKNLVIFLPIFFSKNLFNFKSFSFSFIGFIALCFMSSTNYIINDLIDYEKDKKHPEKKHRVLASKKISKKFAKLLVIIFFSLSIYFSFFINNLFFVFPTLLFLSTLTYSLFAKNVPLIDLQFIALNFIIRTVSGMNAINVGSSPWLLVMVYLLALFLGLSKRLSDKKILGKNPEKHKKVYAFYTEDLLKNYITIITAMLLSTYSFYTFLASTSNNLMMLTIPIVVFILQRYLHLVLSNHKAGRNTELILFDKYIVCGVLFWLLICFISFYLA